MASIKIARTALIAAGLPAMNAQAFMDKLNTVFGANWTCDASGICLGTQVLLPKANFMAFLAEKPGLADVTIKVSLPSPGPGVAVPVEIADYYENDDGTYSCAHCNHKPYKREKDCVKHLQKKHADKLEE